MSSALKVHLDQGSQEWLNWRNGRVCASDVPIIMLESPFSTPYALWEQKMGLAKPKKTSYRMQRGKDLEPRMLELAEQRLGVKLAPAVVQSRSIKYMGASLDAISDDGAYLCEFKAPGKIDHESAKQGQIPKKYIGQLNHMMEVCQVEKLLYLSYYDESDIVYLTYERDDCYIGHMLEKEAEFWLCMQEFCAPPLLECDFRTRDDEVWDNLAHRYQHITNSIKDLEKEQLLIREALIKESSDYPTMGAGIRVCKHVRRGSIDYKNIPQIQEIDLELYRSKPTSYWRIG